MALQGKEGGGGLGEVEVAGSSGPNFSLPPSNGISYQLLE